MTFGANRPSLSAGGELFVSAECGDGDRCHATGMRLVLMGRAGSGLGASLHSAETVQWDDVTEAVGFAARPRAVGRFCHPRARCAKPTGVRLVEQRAATEIHTAADGALAVPGEAVERRGIAGPRPCGARHLRHGYSRAVVCDRTEQGSRGGHRSSRSRVEWPESDESVLTQWTEKIVVGSREITVQRGRSTS